MSCGGTGYPDPVGIKDTPLTAGNPATEDKQDNLIAKFTFEDHQYMGSQAIGSYVYYGFKQKGGTGWYLMRKNTADDSAWQYAYSSESVNGWLVARGDPTGESYGDPPDS